MHFKPSSAICFNLDQSKMLLSGKELTKIRSRIRLRMVGACGAYMALIFHFRCTLKRHMQFASIWTSLKFCCLVRNSLELDQE